MANETCMDGKLHKILQVRQSNYKYFEENFRYFMHICRKYTSERTLLRKLYILENPSNCCHKVKSAPTPPHTHTHIELNLDALKMSLQHFSIHYILIQFGVVRGKTCCCWPKWRERDPPATGKIYGN